MKKIINGFLCGLVVIGIANLSHAGLFSLLGGGGGGKNKAASHRINPSTLFNFDFSKFKIDTDSEKNDYNIHKPVIEDFLIDLISNPIGGPTKPKNDREKPFYSDFIIYPINDPGINKGINPNTHNTTPVPEPATMLLLGIGLIGLAGLSRRKLKTI